MSKIEFNNSKTQQTHKEYIAEAKQRKHFTNVIADKLLSAIDLINEANLIKFNSEDYSLSKYYNQVQALEGCSTRFFSETWESKTLQDIKRKTKPFRTCKNKFCSICAKIRSNKLFYDTYNVIKYIKDNEITEFIPYHLTLTIKNPNYSQFNHYYNVMNEAFKDMFDKKQKSKIYKLRDYVLGWQCAREITQSPEAKGRGEFHPHMHILLLLKTDFVDKFRVSKLTKKDILLEWNNALQAQDKDFPITSQIELQKIKQNQKDKKIIIDNEAKAIAEVSKYPIKPEDLINMDNVVLFDLMQNLENKRMVTFGGLIKEVRKLLNFVDDCVVDSFIHSEEYNLRSVKLYNYINGNYKRQNIRKKDLLEFRVLSSSELTELNYSKDKDNILLRSPALRQYNNRDFKEIDTIPEVANYKDYENIKDCDTGVICKTLLELAEKDLIKAKQIKEYNQLLNLLTTLLKINKMLLFGIKSK
jgi:hypothetical protein